MMVLASGTARKTKDWARKSLRDWLIRSAERSPSHLITVRQSGWIFRLSQHERPPAGSRCYNVARYFCRELVPVDDLYPRPVYTARGLDIDGRGDSGLFRAGGGLCGLRRSRDRQ